MIDLEKYSPAARILALKLTGQVGPRTFASLIAYLKTVDNILLAEEDELRGIPGIGAEKSKAIYKSDNHLDTAQQMLDLLAATDTRVATCFDPEYPSSLNVLNDPPMLLYYQGQLPRDDDKIVSIIGSGEVSAEGIGDVVELAKVMVENKISIASGLARGIDAAAHTGTLKAGGRTFACLPSGFNHIYPAEHVGLSREITNHGALLSEYLPETAVSAGRLISRNRLTVALSQAVIIGEVSENSVGTLDAARCCNELGKLMFTIIGKNNPHYETLAGYGAIPLTSIDDYNMVLTALV